MKIKITTDVGVWIDGAPAKRGDVADVDGDAAELMISRGHAEKVSAPRKKKADADG